MINTNRVTLVTLIACAAMPAILRAQEPAPPPPRPTTIPRQHAKPPMNAPPARPGDVSKGDAPNAGKSVAINQGTVTIRAESTGRVTIYRDGVRVGAPPVVLKQRLETKRWYEVRDEKGAVMCGDTIAIDEPYQRVERLCRRGSRHLTEVPAQPQ